MTVDKMTRQIDCRQNDCRQTDSQNDCSLGQDVCRQDF